MHRGSAFRQLTLVVSEDLRPESHDNARDLRWRAVSTGLTVKAALTTAMEGLRPQLRHRPHCSGLPLPMLTRVLVARVIRRKLVNVAWKRKISAPFRQTHPVRNMPAPLGCLQPLADGLKAALEGGKKGD